jgi:hypothetical protein
MKVQETDSDVTCRLPARRIVFTCTARILFLVCLDSMIMIRCPRVRMDDQPTKFILTFP